MGDFDSESEDSDNEGGMGNVSRVVMRPPGHSGKAKKGHLCFDASFETGNLGRIELVSEYEYDLFVRPDTCNPRLRLWFHFTVDNIRFDQHVVFNIVNFSKKRNLFRDGMTPLVRSTSRNKWQRMPNSNVYYHRSPYHMNHYILTLSFGFDKEEDAYHFAFCYPYSYSRCQAHLELIERKNIPHFKRELLGNSIQKRRLDLLTITASKNMNADPTEHEHKLRVVVILSRIHPGESPSSYVCQGMIDFLISNHPIALALRERVVFKIIPMVNPDGVFLGNLSSTLTGADLNRSWQQISHWLHPTLHATFSLLSNLDQDKNMELDFVMDIHAHSSLLGVFVYGNTYDDVYRYERHIVFPKLLAQNTDGYEVSNTMYNRDVNKAGTARRVLCDALKDSVNCYSLLVSFYGYRHQSVPGIHYYTEESYYRLGRNVVRTYLEYYRIIGVLNPAEKETKGIHKERNRSRVRSHTSSAKPLRPPSHRTASSSSDTSAHHISLNLQEVQPQQQTIPTLRRRRTRLRSHHKQVVSVAQRRSWPVSGVIVQSAPHISIIDFNTLIRGGLELAIQRNNRKTKSSKPRNKKFRSRKAQSASQISNEESDSPG